MMSWLVVGSTPITETHLPAGLVGELISFHVEPDHAHVSFLEPQGAPPPKTTTVPKPGSTTVMASNRCDGLVAGLSWLHAVPFHDHVSPRPGPAPVLLPPNMMMLPLPGYVAIDTYSRPGGLPTQDELQPAGFAATCAHVAPVQVHVSLQIKQAVLLPPNRTIRPFASTAMPAP